MPCWSLPRQVIVHPTTTDQYHGLVRWDGAPEFTQNAHTVLLQYQRGVEAYVLDKTHEAQLPQRQRASAAITPFKIIQFHRIWQLVYDFLLMHKTNIVTHGKPWETV